MFVGKKKIALKATLTGKVKSKENRKGTEERKSHECIVMEDQR